jgi:hypothetical protein
MSKIQTLKISTSFFSFFLSQEKPFTFLVVYEINIVDGIGKILKILSGAQFVF